MILSNLTWVDDPEFRLAYARSGGLCVPHAMRAVELVRGGRERRLGTLRNRPPPSRPLKRPLHDGGG